MIEEYDYFRPGEDYNNYNLNINKKIVYLDDKAIVTFEKMDSFMRTVEEGTDYDGRAIIKKIALDDYLGKTRYTTEKSYNDSTTDNYEYFFYDKNPLGRIKYYKELGSDYFKKFNYLSVDASTRKVELRDENNKLTQKFYDSFGQLVKIINPLLDSTTFRYDVLGNVEEMTLANMETSYFNYDSRNLLSQRDTPEKGVWNYKYNARGDLEFESDAYGNTIRYWYDDLGRLEKIDYPNDVDVEFSYDSNGVNSIGKVTSMTDVSGRTLYFYDDKGRLEREEINIFGTDYLVRYSYDKSGMIKKIVGPDNTVIDYYYDERGLVDHFDVNGRSSFVDYYANGRIKQINHPNGVITKYFYNDRGWVSAIDISKDGEAVFSRTYKYDSPQGLLTVGNLFAIYEGVANDPGSFDGLDELTIFGYDDNYRLLSADFYPQDSNGCSLGPDCEDLSVTYDAVGNRKSKNGIPYSYDDPVSASRLTDDGTYAYEYDANGNLISKTHKLLGAVTVYDWDDAGRLSSVTLPSGFVEKYFYDGKDRRVRKEMGAIAVNYVYDQFDNVIYEDYLNLE